MANQFRLIVLIAAVGLGELGFNDSALAQLRLRDTDAQCVSVPNNEIQRLPPPPEVETGPRKVFPEPGLLELGLLGGLIVPSIGHDLRQSDMHQRRYGRVASDVGVRLAYFPLTFVGLESEGVVVPTHVKRGDDALLWALRGHVVIQLPTSDVVPFATFGYGALGGVSDEMGRKTLPAFDLGIGAKMVVDRALSVRVDLRDTVARANSDHGSIAHFPELLVGVTMTFGRSDAAPAPPVLPDNDGDGVPNDNDTCPSRAARTSNGCPDDTDIDGIFDENDRCPTEAGPRPTGCPLPSDRDRDGVNDDTDACPDSFGVSKNGCPDNDPDRDGIKGDADRCPIDAETLNHRDDEDGCPD